jgi:hypothetical protein
MEDNTMKRFYIAVTIAENDKYYAYGVPVSQNDNVLSKLKIDGILQANICETKTKCREIVNLWNESYRLNGTHMFEGGPF